MAQKIIATLRVLYGLILFGAGVQKIWLGWFSSGVVELEFQGRVQSLGGGFQAAYLELLAIPFAYVIGVFVTVSQLSTGLAFMLGIHERSAAILSAFLYLNFILGGYFFIQALPIILLPFLFFAVPTGHIWGLRKIA